MDLDETHPGLHPLPYDAVPVDAVPVDAVPVDEVPVDAVRPAAAALNPAGRSAP